MSEKTKKQAKKVDNVAKNLQKYRREVAIIDSFGRYNTYPANYVSIFDHELREALRRDYVAFLGNKEVGGEAFGKGNVMIQHLITDKSIEAEIQHEAEREFAQFEQWVTHTYNPSNPTSRKLLKRLLPNYYQRRKEHIAEVKRIQSRIFELKEYLNK